MKKMLLPIVVLLITIGILSCQKSGVNTTTSLLGKWNVKSDTLDYGIGPQQQTKIYLGVAGDYFDFRADHKLYIKEGTLLDTLTYKVISATKLQVTPTGAKDGTLNLFIDNITSTSANINFFPILINPGGNDDRWVSLEK
jgi:hypothetical protein